MGQDSSRASFSSSAEQALLDVQRFKTGPYPSGRETVELTDCAIREVRTISHLLHPPLLEELGFLPAARWYLDEYGKRSRVKVSLRIEEPIQPLPRDIEIALFRVLQESLANVYRHAAAQSVDVRILCNDGQVSLNGRRRWKGNSPGCPDQISGR